MMVRRSTLIWSAFVIGVGIGLYFVKHEVHDLEERLSTLHHTIAQQRETIHVLEAEWAFLNRPERLEDLGGRLLDLEPVSASRVITLGELVHGPKAAAMPVKDPAGSGGTAWARAIMADLEKAR